MSKPRKFGVQFKLTSNWSDHRECHVGGDFLLIYFFPDKQSVTFVSTGTHSELFG